MLVIKKESKNIKIAKIIIFMLLILIIMPLSTVQANERETEKSVYDNISTIVKNIVGDILGGNVGDTFRIDQLTYKITSIEEGNRCVEISRFTNYRKRINYTK